MTGYLVRRILWLLPVLVGVTFLVFLTMHLAPGDPVKIMLGPRATEETLNRVRTELGLDRPMPVQYVSWISRVLAGDWGRSIQLRTACTSPRLFPFCLDGTFGLLGALPCKSRWNRCGNRSSVQTTHGMGSDVHFPGDCRI